MTQPNDSKRVVKIILLSIVTTFFLLSNIGAFFSFGYFISVGSYLPFPSGVDGQSILLVSFLGMILLFCHHDDFYFPKNYYVYSFQLIIIIGSLAVKSVQSIAKGQPIELFIWSLLAILTLLTLKSCYNSSKSGYDFNLRIKFQNLIISSTAALPLFFLFLALFFLVKTKAAYLEDILFLSIYFLFIPFYLLLLYLSIYNEEAKRIAKLITRTGFSIYLLLLNYVLIVSFEENAENEWMILLFLNVFTVSYIIILFGRGIIGHLNTKMSTLDNSEKEQRKFNIFKTVIITYLTIISSILAIIVALAQLFMH